MNETPYQKLAEQYLELWQKQMGAVLTDRDFIQSMLKLMAAMQPPQASPHHEQTPADPAAFPGAFLERVEQLDYRIRMLERRLAALECLIGERTKKPGRKPARKSSSRR